MTWKPDPRTERRIGPYVVVSERDGSETAHRVSFPDDRGLRVLPDGRASGQRRSRTITEALTEAYSMAPVKRADLDEVYEFDPVLYLVGALAAAGMAWESTGARDITIAEWLTEWFEHGAQRFTAAELLKDLDADGWQVVRKGEA